MRRSKKDSTTRRSKRKRRRPLRRCTGPTVLEFPERALLWERETAMRLKRSLSPHPNAMFVVAGLELACKAFGAWSDLSHQGDFQVAMITLFIKATNDIVAAFLLCRSGYYFPAWPLTRRCVEATELMEYFRKHPGSVIEWLENDPKFYHLAWIRRELPASQERRNFYDTVNETTHSNWREAHLFSSPGEITDSRRPYLGPFQLEMPEKGPTSMLPGRIAYPPREFHQLCADLVSDQWKALLEDPNSATNYPFSGKMGSRSGEVTRRLASWMESLMRDARGFD